MLLVVFTEIFVPFTTLFLVVICNLTFVAAKNLLIGFLFKLFTTMLANHNLTLF